MAYQANNRGPLEVFQQLLEQYSGEWETTACSTFGDNFRALRHILHSSSLDSVTNIVVYGLGNGGLPEAQIQNVDRTLPGYLEYDQKTFFTQIAVTRRMRDLIAERFQRQITVYAHDPDCMPHTHACLRFLGIIPFSMHPFERWWWHDKGTLIYDVTKDRRLLCQKINYRWQGDLIPPAAILTCANSLVRYRGESPSGDLPKEINPQFLRKYYMIPMMDLQTQTTVPSDERPQEDAIRDREDQSRDMAQLRERESELTRWGYERKLAQHDAMMGRFEEFLTERASEIAHNSRNRIDPLDLERARQAAWPAAWQAAWQAAWRENRQQTPRATNSYVGDAMLVLLSRKPEPTEEPIE